MTQYIYSLQNQLILTWNGKEIKIASFTPHLVNLIAPISVIKEIYLSQGKIDEPSYESIESLARIQQTSQSAQNIVKLLNAQLSGIDGADGRAIAKAAEEAGIHTEIFFSSLAHKLTDTLLPSPWTIIFILIILIGLLILIYVLIQRFSNKNNTKMYTNPAVENRSQIINELREICAEN
jgi:beta-lactamase regulating signal transducer with metallopeptidase domain